MLIDKFTGKYRFLSNFYPARVTYGGVTYSTVEHAYQASKTLDIPERVLISAMPTPGNAKREGRHVTLRPDWENVKLVIMEELLQQKFAIPELRKALLDTGNSILIEGNNWGDSFWGTYHGIGANHLGKLLMKIREELK